MEKNIFKYKILLLGLLFIIPFFAYSATIEVCQTCDVKTIKQGIAKAENGDKVCVQKGVYKENNIVVDKAIILEAEKGVIVDGENIGEVMRVIVDGVTIDGFEIINVGTSSLKDFSAIRISRSNNFIVQNVVLQQPFFGIFLERANYGIVRNNKVYGKAKNEYNSGNGFHLWYSTNNVLENNYVNNQRDGFYLEFSDDNHFKNNVSSNNIRYGLHFMFCHRNEVDSNEFQHNGAGIAIMFSKFTNMHDNFMHDNWGGAAYGVLLKEATDSKIIRNRFERNTTALNVEGASRVVFENNDFISNGWGANCKGGNRDVTFTKNNFLNNSFDVAFNSSSMVGNSFNGNYWSEYNGYDLDRDGVGDVPYRPVKLFTYMVSKSPESIILLRSMFVDLVDFAERVSPVFTPDKLMDETPSMKMFIHEEYHD